MKNFIFTFVLVIAIAFSAFAEGLQFSRLAAVETLVVPDNELSNVIAASLTTWPIPNIPSPDERHYSYAHIDPKRFTKYSDTKLVAFEFNTITDFIQGNGIFSQYKDNSAKIVLANVYGFEAEAAVSAMKLAANSGLYASIIATDGPISAKSDRVKDPNKYQGSDKYTNQISPDDLGEKEGSQGHELRKLLAKDGGYEFRSPTHNSKEEGDELIKRGDHYITMSAFYRNITIGPIQHLKEKVMIVLKDPNLGMRFDANGRLDASNIKALFVISGNGNATPRAHNNISRFFDGQKNRAAFELCKFTVEHSLAILKTFAVKGKTARIDDIVFDRVLRVQGASGDSMFERAYTDGKYEINDRLAVILSAGGKSFGPSPKIRGRNKYNDFSILNAAANGLVTEITLSHFVLTNRDFVSALYQAWKAAKDQGHPFKIKGVLDGKFVGMRSYGLAASLKGLTAENPFGKEVEGLDPELAKYVEIVVNIERVANATNINPDGPPSSNILQHGKMTLLKLKTKMKNGAEKIFAVLADGSMNMSGNETNLEVQDLFIVPEGAEAYEFAKRGNEALFNRVLGRTADGRPRGYKLEDYLNIAVIAKLLGLDVEQINLNDVKGLSITIGKIPTMAPAQRKHAISVLKLKLSKMHAETQSKLTAGLQVSEETLGKNLNEIGDFMNLYSSLIREEQGEINSFSIQERLDIIGGLIEDPISAKKAISRILKRNYLPYDILEQRAYQIYQDLNLEKFFREKGVLNPVFPIYKNRLLPPMENDEAARIEAALKNKIYPAAADELIKIVSAKLKDQSLKVEIADAPGVLRRLPLIMDVLKSLHKLPNKLNSTFNPSLEYLENHLWTENYELLLLLNGYDRNAGQIVYYLLVQKGYRNDELRHLSNEALAKFGMKPIEGPIPVPARAQGNICSSLF